ncbi:vomeronasal type-2 receptor 26-like [Rana temporaria]|uniref:vomeronasal type-2 receptor 26-like n=1 Tax=Rana temporaria TaxID=8407 RepID=UPI001AAC6876|nr:vomeronasal type-2 receptor 26-like [Rana temporaria]
MGFFFAIDEINKDPNILPNITLGYHLFDTCGYIMRAIDSTLQILSGAGMLGVPNYSCMKNSEVAGFVGDATFPSTLAVAELLYIYQYPQISHRVADPLLSEREKFPNFYRTVPSNWVWYELVIEFLKMFGWNWVGIITSSDGTGETELRELRKEMTRHGICIEFVVYLTSDVEINRRRLHRYVRTVKFKNCHNQDVMFNEKGELPSEFILVNMVFFDPDTSNWNVVLKLVQMTNDFSKRKTEEVAEVSYWKQGKVPKARCGYPCPPGSRKVPTEGIHICCYHCVPCSDGEISNKTDSDICHQCPVDTLPDKRKITCIPKTYDYLSYETNIIALAFYFISILCSAETLSILTLFIIFRDTPIVKANNRTVSFILLNAILLSFLCVFFFLGRPVDITCMLRQISFGIFFSIAVSSVLAKTITVCIAFRASKPGSYWKKWVGEKTSNSVVIIGSSVQVLICVVWLSVSPPYQEYDMDSYPGKIIIQCNEGSVIGFYSMLGYLGFLAAVSFLLAFMVRTLPDSFNEAKYITFSMLVFCSVWIAMIPAYLSTRGKYMVAVEVFAILTSSAGLLGCIFFPKCYIIIIQPQRNTRKNIFDKVKS